MTVFIEISRPFQRKPGRYTSRIMYRFWWGWVAVGVLRIPFREFSENEYRWEASGNSIYREQ